jgi:hypothetical protein
MLLNYNQITRAEHLSNYEYMTQTNWTYSREEWTAFLRCKKRKTGILSGLAHFLLMRLPGRIPVVKIMPGKITIGNSHHDLSTDRHRVRKIDLRNEGGINVMEISFGSPGDRRSMTGEIRVPIPKGKLKEAIQWQEKLLINTKEKL